MNNYDKFSAGSMEKGVDNYNPDFSSELALDNNSYNVSSGINRGLGPRYGVVCLPGQQHTEGSTSTDTLSLRQCEDGNSSFSYRSRLKVLACFPISEYFPGTGQTGPQTYYIWVVGNDTDGTSSSLNKIDVVISSEVATAHSVSCVFPSPNIASGVNYSLTNPSSFTYDPHDTPILRMNIANTGYATLQTYVSDIFEGFTKYFISAAVISVGGKDVPFQWMAAARKTVSSSTTPGQLDFTNDGSSYANTINTPLGAASTIQLGTYRQSTRGIKTYNTYGHATYGQALGYSFHFANLVVDSTTYIAAHDNAGNVNQFDHGATNATRVNRIDGTTPAASDVDGKILFNDPELVSNTSYKAVLVPGKRPLAMVVQGWNRGLYGYPFQLIDLSFQRLKPATAFTADHTAGTGTEYKEDSIRKNTCWSAWPVFDSSSSLTKASTNPRTTTTLSSANSCVALGDASTGVLRSNSVYEFTYSVYDKFLGYETNVGAPAKIKTGSDDNVRISLYRDILTGGSYRETCAASFVGASTGSVVFRLQEPNTGRIIPINQIEYRVYYRKLGTYEWLPALFIDAAKYHYYPEFKDGLWACEAPIAALPGGQPGGFIDYSELPNDEYLQTFVYKNRAFWISKSNMVFSLKDNIFCYPLRNNTPAPTGGFRGAIVHTYRGQSEQESRLVIFGGKETYIGRFTGIMRQQPVVISPDVIESFDVDGSDFNVEPWTSVTAFSYRSAVVADGDLYWWGQQGIYMDDGVGNPIKISEQLEPDIFDLYEQSKTEEIFATYNEKTKEIIWFYPPKTASTITYAIVYNVKTKTFLFQRFTYKIDWAQTIDTSNAQVTQDLGGLRTLIGARTTSAGTVQRPYYFDQFTRAGDHGPNLELMVKKVEDGASSGQKKLTLASGYNSTNVSTIVAGSYISIQQFKKYTGQTTGDDIFAKVASVGTGTITITMPTGATLPNVTLSNTKLFFPIWHRTASGAGLNGISWQMSSKYWMPAGVDYNAIWRWIYMFFKYVDWYKVDHQTLSMAYRTPSGADFITDTISFSDNSDSNCQIYHALQEGGLNNQGQAIKLKLSGIHLAEEWVLQYLQAYTDAEKGDILKMYQG